MIGLIGLNHVVVKAHATSKRVWERGNRASVEQQMNVASRLTAILGSMLVVIACSIGLPSQVSALTLTTSSPEFMGIVVSGEPADPANEVVYINTLADQNINTVTTIAGHDYKRSGNTLCFNSCVDAIVAGADTDNTGGNSVDLGDGFLYLLGKYDGPNGGDVIWYVAGLSGSITIPSDLTGTGLCTRGACGLSHWALYTPDDGHKVPEPSTLLLLGAGLIVVSRFARKLK